MSTNQLETSIANLQNLDYLGDDLDFDSDTDGESVTSLETDDGQDHKPEKILAQQDLKFNRPNDAFCTWYLVKWEDCPVIRSSWEIGDLFSKYPHLLQDWTSEKDLQAKGRRKR